MIRVYLPGAASAALTTFLTNKTINSVFYPVTFHSSGITFPVGLTLELDEPDESWPTLKITLTAMASTLGLSRIRIHFAADMDVSKTTGRLAPRAFWLSSDGSQSEF